MPHKYTGSSTHEHDDEGHTGSDTAAPGDDGPEVDQASDGGAQGPTTADPHGIRHAVQSYRERRWKVARLRRLGKMPADTGWQTANPTPEEFGPDDNVGIILGAASGGLYDIDLDEAWVVKLAPRFIPVSSAVFGRASKPGSHHIYKVTGDETLTRETFTDPVDAVMLAEIRGDDHQSMAPPSIHPSGEIVRWQEPTRLGEALVLRDSPGEPTEIALATLRDKLGVLVCAASLVRHYPTWATRHHDLMLALVGLLARAGKSEKGVEAFVRAVGCLAGDADVQDRERIVESTFKRVAHGEPVAGWTLLADVVGEKAASRYIDWLGARRGGSEYERNDLGNADRLVDRYGELIRYCPVLGGWQAWDGQRWERDTQGSIQELAKATVRAMAVEAASIKDADEREKALRHAAASHSMTRIKAMIEAARSDPDVAIRASAFDTDPWAFNVTNGTVNLRTGGIAPHERRDYHRRLSPVAYDAGAKSPLWDAFLARIQPDPEMRAYLQRAVGYSMTGLTREQGIFLPLGEGANGKTTFIETLAFVYGTYFRKLPTSTLMAKKGEGGIPNDLAQLPGTRFVVANETSQGGRLDEAAVKDLTGGDTISARFMRGEWFTFKPTFKVWLYGNHKPVIRGTDNGIWRRIKPVPFGVTIPAEERDDALGERLRTELSGILRWCVEGCLAWQVKGLAEPSSVTGATAEYRDEMDALGQFFAECCETRSGSKTKGADLYTAYTNWAKANGEYALSNRVFGLELARRGVAKLKSGGAIWWTGVKLNVRGEAHRRGETFDPYDGTRSEAVPP